jgi:alpha-amylase/alpha-mannosidase (GH57 family)
MLSGRHRVVTIHWRMNRRFLCLHGHFYQPPRENPWIEELEVQDTAAPFHDWNERITAECYGPNAAARIKDGGGRIRDIVNNYRHVSFNFGPTLLAWLERRAPEVYQRVLDADAESARRRGHGNAIAQAYSHAILPLCNERDRRTQVRWGIADFRKRFSRKPEGMWLPETAADLATLRVLADEGIRFTVLSPFQAMRVRSEGGEWEDARHGQFDPTLPYRVALGEGRHFTVFFYDGPIARGIAFGEGLSGADELVQRFEKGFDQSRGHDELLCVAVDGETFGHHKKGGDEVLAAALRQLQQRDDIELVNLAQAVELCPPRREAEIGEGSSWSCAHGIERWRSDCGCRAGDQPGWHQRWRGPLRAALDELRDRLAELYEREAAKLFRDPWAARDELIELILDPDRRAAAEFVDRQAGRTLEERDRVTALELLEMQRQAILMYTSCGWFFAEISGLETVQILKYAARAIQLAHDACGADLEPAFVEALSRAPSNVPELGDGARVYEALVKPSVASLEGVAAHFAIASQFDEHPRARRLFCYDLAPRARRREKTGGSTLALSRVEVRSRLTHEKRDLSACVLHFSGADFRCGLRHWDTQAHAEADKRLFARFAGLSLAQVVREIDRDFPGRDYTLRDLFLDERRRLADRLLAGTMRVYEDDFQHIYEENRRLVDFLREIDSPVPRPLQLAADVALSRQAQKAARALAEGKVDLGTAQAELLAAAQLARKLGARIDPQAVEPEFHDKLHDLLEQLVRGAREAAAPLAGLVELSVRLGLHLDLWEAQNRLWDAAPRLDLDPDLLARLGRGLWFDENTLLARAHSRRWPEPQPHAAAAP